MFSARHQRGYTLIELMVAVLISLIVLGVVAAVFIIQNRHYEEQQQIVQMQEGARFAVQMMTNDLTMAGYDPTGSASVGFVASGTSATSIRFRSDLDGDGNTTCANEDVTYAFNSGTGQLTRKSTAADTATPMVENINVLTFTYYDADGNTTTNPAEIRKIRIQVTVQNQSGDRTKTLTTDVQPRNPALKPPPAIPLSRKPPQRQPASRAQVPRVRPFHLFRAWLRWCCSQASTDLSACSIRREHVLRNNPPA